MVQPKPAHQERLGLRPAPLGLPGLVTLRPELVLKLGPLGLLKKLLGPQVPPG